MNEASKTNKVRSADFALKYLQGRVIDIGASTDPVCSDAEIFDLAQGDANRILDFRSKESYDTVHSSHCLEHMHNPPEALRDWWALVKPGGYLILVVPDEDYYEQGRWPSWFNGDHKATFTLGRATSWSPVSYDILALVNSLQGGEVLSAIHQIQGYDLHYQRRYDQDVRRIDLVDKIVWRIQRIPVVGDSLAFSFLKSIYPFGIVIDQTRYGALAQIEIIVRKS